MTSTEDKQFILSLITNTVQNGALKSTVCEMLNIPMRTVQRWEESIDDKRKYRKIKPKNKLTPEERQEIVNICCDLRFIDKSPKEIVPILAEEGIYIASDSTFFRILRENKMLQHRENTHFRTKRHKVKELIATGPNQVWSWDITYLKTCIKGIYYYLYLFMDVWSRKIVAWDIFEEQTSEDASTVLLKINGQENLKNIHLHSDNGAPMKGSTFLATLYWLGIVPSFSRPRCSNDNAYSESLFKTVKYKTDYPKFFKSIDLAKVWINDFVNWYNNEHRHSGINYVTPNQRHTGTDIKILEIRKKTYELAKNKNPERWIQNKIRNWEWEKEQVLNPENKIKNKEKKRQVA